MEENEQKPGNKKPSRLSRRQFLHWTGVAGLAPVLQQRPLRKLQPVEKPQPKKIALPSSFMLSVIRPDDLLNLDFEFINLKLRPGSPPALIRQNPAAPAYMIILFPPQSIAEEAFWEAAGEFSSTASAGKFRVFSLQSNSDVPRTPPVMSRISGRTRLAFRIPDDVAEIPYALESLLDWDSLEPNLVPVALPPSQEHLIAMQKATLPSLALPKAYQAVAPAPAKAQAQPRTQTPVRGRVARPVARVPIPPIVQPGPLQTSIEMPYRLMVSPDAQESWRHAVQAVTRNGRTELWHTRLAAVGPDGFPVESPDAPLHIRAVWSPDCRVDNIGGGPGHANTPFRMSLDPQDRHELVHLTSNFALKRPDQRPLVPEPVDVTRMMLTSLGAWLQSAGYWEPPAPLTVQEWRHRATLGRDHFVRVVYKGYLMPFGNQASLIKVTERKFYKREDGQQIAYMFQRMFIVVRRPEKTIPMPFQPNDGRDLPFRRVKITTLVTPSLNKPEDSAVSGFGQSAFWPRVGSADFPFHVVGLDWEGNSVEFDMPMLFVDNSCAYDRDKMVQVISGYNGTKPAERRQPIFNGQKVAFAAPVKKGDTSLEVQSMTFGVKSVDTGTSKESYELADQPMAFPLMAESSASIPALKSLAGLEGTRIMYPDPYIKNGLGGNANKGELFAQMIEPPTMSFSANRGDKAGGVASPSFSLAGLSRVLGPVGSPSATDKSVFDDVLQGRFDPTKIFNDTAKLLGGILLKDIVEVVADFLSSTDKALVMKNETVEEGGAPTAVKTVMQWKPKLHDASIFIASRNGQEATLTLNATSIVPLNGQPPTYDIRGELTDFTLDLVKPIESFVKLMFSKFTFAAKSGQKASVSPEIAGLEFQGALKFVKELLDNMQMPGGGFGEPIIDVTTAGAKLGYSFGIPTVGFGVFTLQNIRLTTEIDLPFNGDPLSLRFAFNERSSPFLLTVAMFGGGGYFAMVLTSEKIQSVEASLEFGGSFALNIGVASGSLTLMAGVYFKYENDKVKITGYVRCNGSVDVLGLISISAEFYMSLTYDGDRNSVWGQASLTVKIEILFFSASVTLSVEREFGHSPAPLFCDLMDNSHWLSYCEAFA